ncbi:unnamed protein product [Kuraishia capsulata CBS 1993]|uniref:Zn(2)-C6 fungal-type domain-containing protein n=1 Tax=Kuraishia capsulata CBS 1993 TaxID=1382522 RepID=W6MM78_9ASCO|nr:uncharacterized protein KUCA_T00003643001 [Kuraishia capsulata CBS 1993]CDK27664.1 unnamed protein product [Kuraishia capsulata CBS 1993]
MTMPDSSKDASKPSSPSPDGSKEESPDLKQAGGLLDPMPPRKRSKVSRACDECRRKKIRCDAMVSAQSCSNCKKTNDKCTFTRVPLKRGPSRSQKHSEDFEVRRQSFPQIMPLQQQQQLQHQVQQRPQPSQTNQSSQQILLPPLSSLSHTGSILPPPPHPINPLDGRVTNLLNAAKPRSNSLTSNGYNSQALFWKVPYELPTFERRNSTDSMSSSISVPFSPQVLNQKPASGSSNGNSPMYRPISGYDSVGISDSEDEFLNSQRPSFISVPHTKDGTVSPALSVTSLSSLNQNINKGLQISPITNQNRTLNLLKAIEYNLDIYYSKYNKKFPILPVQRSFISSVLPTLINTDENIPIVELFNTSLRMLITCDSPSFNFMEVIGIFQRADHLYALKNYIGNHESLKLIFGESLIILNYCIILSGHDYSMGLAITFAILNDWKFYNRLKALSTSPETPSDFEAYTARAFVGFIILDTVYSLSFGNQRLTFSSNDIVAKDSAVILSKLFPDEDPSGFKIGLNLVLLTMGHASTSVSEYDVVSILKSRQELFKFFQDQRDHYAQPKGLSDDDLDEYIFESQIRFFKLSKKLSAIAGGLISGYLPSPGGESPKAITHVQQQVCPFSLISLITCLKTTHLLLKLVKSLVQLNAATNTNDLASRLPKIEADLAQVDTNFSTKAVYPLPSMVNLLKVVQVSSPASNLLNIQPGDSTTFAKFRSWSLDVTGEIESILTKEAVEGLLSP